LRGATFGRLNGGVSLARQIPRRSMFCVVSVI
jgi:hypothetical protein